MAGLLGFLAAGAAKGAGDGIVAEARAKREAALKTLDHNRTLQRDQADRDFTRSERIAGEQFKAREGALDRSATARENAQETFRPASPEEAARYGATAGQFGPDNRFYENNPPSGMTVEVGADGGVRLVQGPAASSSGKAPTGFEADPNNPGGVRPIAGGPGEQLPAEFAGRIGIADSFLGQAPDLREKILSGGVTGPWDRAQAGNNSSSPQATIYRQLQSGADALQRLLTGAGMTENEAAIYAQRYLPSYTDSAESAANKLDQMVREIENVRAASLRGRGGSGATVTPNGPTGGDNPSGSGSKTTRGVTWSVD